MSGSSLVAGRQKSLCQVLVGLRVDEIFFGFGFIPNEIFGLKLIKIGPIQNSIPNLTDR